MSLNTQLNMHSTTYVLRPKVAKQIEVPVVKPQCHISVTSLLLTTLEGRTPWQSVSGAMVTRLSSTTIKFQQFENQWSVPVNLKNCKMTPEHQ